MAPRKLIVNYFFKIKKIMLGEKNYLLKNPRIGHFLILSFEKEA
jgi:hypothetical protein